MVPKHAWIQASIPVSGPCRKGPSILPNCCCWYASSLTRVAWHLLTQSTAVIQCSEPLYFRNAGNCLLLLMVHKLSEHYAWEYGASFWTLTIISVLPSHVLAAVHTALWPAVLWSHLKKWLEHSMVLSVLQNKCKWLFLSVPRVHWQSWGTLSECRFGLDFRLGDQKHMVTFFPLYKFMYMHSPPQTAVKWTLIELPVSWDLLLQLCQQGMEPWAVTGCTFTAKSINLTALH